MIRLGFITQIITPDLPNRLNEQSYILLILVIFLILPIVVLVLRNMSANVKLVIDTQNRQIDAQNNQLSAFREEGAKQRLHDEAMIAKANKDFNERFERLQEKQSDTTDKLIARHAHTDEMIATNSATLITGLKTMNDIQSLNGENQARHFEGIKQMLNDNGDTLKRLLTGVESLQAEVHQTRMENQQHYEALETKFAAIDDVLGAVKQSIQTKLDETGSQPPSA